MRARALRVRLLIAGLFGLLVGGRPAQAMEFYFDIVATPTTAICPEPCFQVRMFVEDQTRVVDLQAVQFDVAVVSGGSVATLPVPPANNTNAANGNVVM